MYICIHSSTHAVDRALSLCVCVYRSGNIIIIISAATERLRPIARRITRTFLRDVNVQGVGNGGAARANNNNARHGGARHTVLDPSGLPAHAEARETTFAPSTTVAPNSFRQRDDNTQARGKQGATDVRNQPIMVDAMRHDDTQRKRKQSMTTLLPHQRHFTSAPRKVAKENEPSQIARTTTERRLIRDDDDYGNHHYNNRDVGLHAHSNPPKFQFNTRNLGRTHHATVVAGPAFISTRDPRTSTRYNGGDGETRETDRSRSHLKWNSNRDNDARNTRSHIRRSPPSPTVNAFMTARTRFHGNDDTTTNARDGVDAETSGRAGGAAPAPDPSLVQPYRPPALLPNTNMKSGKAYLSGKAGNDKGRRQPVIGGGGKDDDSKVFSDRTLKLLKLGEDEELPEALEVLDSQFIERICNEVVNTGDPVEWHDIAGCSETKKIVHEVVLYPILNPSLFTGILSPPKGILLFGPPGTGKTMIGKAIASNIQATFFSISATSLTSKWIGEGEMMVRTLFAVARHVQPSVIFIDEIDSLLSSRKSEGEHESSRRMKNQFLVEMDGVSNGKTKNSLLIVGATNRPEEIDEAARRRLPKQIYVPLPDETARRELLLRQLSLAKNGYTISAKGIDNIVRKTEGYSGSDIKQVIQEAAMQPVREVTRRSDTSTMDHIQRVRPEDTRPLSIDDFKMAVHTAQKSVSETEIWRYEKYDKLHGTRIEQRADLPSQNSEGWSE